MLGVGLHFFYGVLVFRRPSFTSPPTPPPLQLSHYINNLPFINVGEWFGWDNCSWGVSVQFESCHPPPGFSLGSHALLSCVEFN